MVVVGANHGITRMTKEHVGMAIALNVPLFVVVTKVDLCPEPVMKETMKQLTRLLKLPGAKKQPYTVRNTDEVRQPLSIASTELPTELPVALPCLLHCSTCPWLTEGPLDRGAPPQA